jgi:LacI family transcriptional regulator
VKHMLRMGVDGLIFASVHLKEPVVEKLIADGFPTVLVNRKLKGASYHHVVCDNFQGAYDITRYLLDLGYRKIAMISGHTYLSTGLDRLKGYQKALKDRGIALSRDYVVEGPFAPETGYNAAKKLLALEDRPEAIFAGNDYIARGVMEAVEEMGLSIPEDVALTGFDNTSFAAMGRNKLTTVSQCRYEMGELAVQILVDTIECKNLDHTHNILLKAEIIVRESCGHKLRKK